MSTVIELQGLEAVMGNLKKVGVTTLRRAYESSQMTAAQLENHSQDVAPWHDRTGNARASIYAYSSVYGDGIIIYHGIGVDYGIYLETANGGRYRVIQPAVDKYRTIWTRNLSTILGL